MSQLLSRVEVVVVIVVINCINSLGHASQSWHSSRCELLIITLMISVNEHWDAFNDAGFNPVIFNNKLLK